MPRILEQFTDRALPLYLTWTDNNQNEFGCIYDFDRIINTNFIKYMN